MLGALKFGKIIEDTGFLAIPLILLSILAVFLVIGVFLGGLCAGIMEMAAWTRGFDNYFADFGNNDKLLTYGSIPFKQIRRLMLEG